MTSETIVMDKKNLIETAKDDLEFCSRTSIKCPKCGTSPYMIKKEGKTTVTCECGFLFDRERYF